MVATQNSRRSQVPEPLRCHRDHDLVENETYSEIGWKFNSKGNESYYCYIMAILIKAVSCPNIVWRQFFLMLIHEHLTVFNLAKHLSVKWGLLLETYGLHQFWVNKFLSTNYTFLIVLAVKKYNIKSIQLHTSISVHKCRSWMNNSHTLNVSVIYRVHRISPRPFCTGTTGLFLGGFLCCKGRLRRSCTGSGTRVQCRPRSGDRGNSINKLGAE